ncbi:MAG TPA: hypothetical protein VM243_19035 [Phycisphaerae bacterium]|nr:hypothetical protein [Phycisphaerae bacterium]
MNGTTSSTRLPWRFAFATLLAVLATCITSCSERRGPTAAEPARQAPATRTQPSAADNYVDQAALQMAEEDQKRSAQSIDREPPVRYRDSPMRPPPQ